ncbi:hypothetical protein DIPPA_23867 [Diplonema papillatum]|nr:hypothetical protein DIPPA_23867 [Diplonema papillatum]
MEPTDYREDGEDADLGSERVGTGPGVGLAAGGVHHVKNNGGKKSSTVFSPVLSLGNNRFEILEREKSNSSIDEEVAGMVSRMVHYVAFEEATRCNGELLVELEGYQKECWAREREKDRLSSSQSRRGHSLRAGSKGRRPDAKQERSASAGTSIPGPTNGTPLAARRSGLEDDLYFPLMGLSLAAGASTGFSCAGSKSDKSGRSQSRFADFDAVATSYTSPLFPGTDPQDPFSRKINELQWMQADTLRSEKAYTGAGGARIDKPADAGAIGAALRCRTPPRGDRTET